MFCNSLTFSTLNAILQGNWYFIICTFWKAWTCSCHFVGVTYAQQLAQRAQNFLFPQNCQGCGKSRMREFYWHFGYIYKPWRMNVWKLYKLRTRSLWRQIVLKRSGTSVQWLVAAAARCQPLHSVTTILGTCTLPSAPVNGHPKFHHVGITRPVARGRMAQSVERVWRLLLNHHDLQVRHLVSEVLEFKIATVYGSTVVDI